MSLERDPEAPYRFKSSAWEPGTAGTFALVIGVSRYHHLDGSANSYLLSSLHTSALTAQRVFAWLDDHYHAPLLDGSTAAPLAQCWFLASPTDEERAVDAELDAAVDATMGACERAIAEWDAAMRGLSAEAARNSTLLFFFSGHGLEVHRSKQLLLPSDYLTPPARNVNKAISTSYLCAGVGDLKVARQLFFVDACRNDMDALRLMNPEGERILNQPQSHLLNPDCNALVFHATASGQQTFQPRDPKEGPSLFGRALLEGLRGADGLELDCSEGGGCTVNVFPLHGFLKNRVGDLLREHGSSARSFVRLDGANLDNLGIARIAQPVVSALRGMPGAAVARPLDRRPPPLSETMAKQYPLSHPMGWHPGGSMESGMAHTVFGSEQLTTMFAGMELFTLDGQPAPHNALRIERVDRDGDSRSLRAELSVPSDQTFWLRFAGDAWGSFACVLPASQARREADAKFLLELDVEVDANRVRHVRDVSLSLSENNGSRLAQAAELWSAYRYLSVAEARQNLDRVLPVEILRYKLDAPLAAAVAGMVLAELGELRYMHDWLRNLANWFELPEGPVLWAYQLAQQGGEVREYQRGAAEYQVIEHDRIVPWLLELEQRGLPRLSGVLEMVADLLERTPLVALDPAEGAAIDRLRTRVTATMRHLRPGSLFAVFYSKDKAELTPSLLAPLLSA